MAASATATISSTFALLLLCAAASLVATAAAAGSSGGHHRLEANNKPAGDDLVAKTCANVTTGRHYKSPGLTREFCESALRSDKRSASARDARDLALVAMDLVQSGAAAAGAKLDGALRSGTDWSKDAAVPLQYCRQDESDVAHTAPQCRALVQGYDPRPGGRNMIPYAYLECADRLIHAARDCWIQMFYQDADVKKAVWKEVGDAASRANLAKAMVEQMVGVVKDEDP